MLVNTIFHFTYRASESNSQGITNQIEEIYQRNSRNGMILKYIYFIKWFSNHQLVLGI